MNYSSPYAPDPIDASAAPPILALPHPELPWKSTDKAKQMFMAVEDTLVKALGAGHTRIIAGWPLMSLYFLYSLICEAFIAQSQGFMPRIVAFSNLARAHHEALDLLESHGRVKVLWFQPQLTSFKPAEIQRLVSANTVCVAMPLQTHYGRRHSAREIESVMASCVFRTALLVDATYVNPAAYAEHLRCASLVYSDLSYAGALDAQLIYWRQLFLEGTNMPLKHYREYPYGAYVCYKLFKNVPGAETTALTNISACRTLVGVSIITYDTYVCTMPAKAIVTINDVNSGAWDPNALIIAVVKDGKIINHKRIQEEFVRDEAYVHAVEIKNIDGYADPILGECVIVSVTCPFLPQVLSRLFE